VLVLLALGWAAPGLAQGLGGLGGGLGGGGLGGGIGGGAIGGIPRLPPPRVPPLVKRVPQTVKGAAGAATDVATGAVQQTQQQLQQAQNQVQQAVDSVGRPPQPGAFEQDTNGARVVKSEVLALSPSDQALAAAQRLNFRVLRQETLGGLNLGVTVLGAPPGMSASDALAALRAADPNGTYDYNHIYDPSEDASAAAGSVSSSASLAASGALVIGLVDGGIDASHPELRDAKIVASTFAGTATPTEHGTAIASLLVGRGRIHGVVPNATLYAADIFGGLPTGGSADAVAQGLAWLAGNHVPVINISRVGPPNRLVETVVRALIARGHVIVAAVGNAGPASPVAYPAAYDGVIAATSVDREGRVQLDANEGPQVAFAALGVDVSAAVLENGYRELTGTSFAAPLVAARFAMLLAAPDPRAAAEARDVLAREAIDLGKPGRDPVFGYGLLQCPPGSHAVSAMAR
jgi:hypothetical protein